MAKLSCRTLMGCPYSSTPQAFRHCLMSSSSVSSISSVILEIFVALLTPTRVEVRATGSGQYRHRIGVSTCPCVRERDKSKCRERIQRKFPDRWPMEVRERTDYQLLGVIWIILQIVDWNEYVFWSYFGLYVKCCRQFSTRFSEGTRDTRLG